MARLIQCCCLASKVGHNLFTPIRNLTLDWSDSCIGRRSLPSQDDVDGEPGEGEEDDDDEDELDDALLVLDALGRGAATGLLRRDETSSVRVNRHCTIIKVGLDRIECSEASDCRKGPERTRKTALPTTHPTRGASIK